MSLIVKNILLFLLICLVSCDVTENTDFEIEFEQRIVIESILAGDQLFEGVSITKTIPLETSYNIDSSAISNATAVLRINEIQTIPLHYNGNGIYKALPSHFLFIRAGNFYELFVEIDDKSYYAKTKIPNTPVVTRPTYDEGNYLTAEVKPRLNEAYTATWVVLDSRTTVESDDFHSVNSSFDLTNVAVRTQAINEEFLNAFYRDSTYIKVYAFDKYFEDFFKTFSNSNSINEAFSQSGGSVNWNISGENVMGLFVGYSTSSLIKP